MIPRIAKVVLIVFVAGALGTTAHGRAMTAKAVSANLAEDVTNVPAKTGSAPAGEEREWYQQGLWPLVGSVAAIIVANAIAVLLVYLQASRSFAALLKQRRIERLSSSLSEFYDPLLALIDMNGEIFRKTGPPSFPQGHIEREAAALVWRHTKLKILGNNEQIEGILKTRSHLLHAEDSVENYVELLLHVAMYETFQKLETDIYAAFRFPPGIREHIATMRSKVLSDYNELTGEPN